MSADTLRLELECRAGRRIGELQRRARAVAFVVDDDVAAVDVRDELDLLPPTTGSGFVPAQDAEANEGARHPIEAPA